jgi:hypothetical protein
MKLSIEIDNITEAQALAIEDILATWLFLKEKKMRMWTAFFADGQYDFKPEIKVNGEEAKKYMGDIGWRVAKVGFKDPEGSYLDDDMYMMDPLLIQRNLNNPSEDAEG